MHEIMFKGCRHEPLADYLKALGIMRILSEQKDQSVKGYWRDGVFFITSPFDEESILDFFVDVYMPTPVVAPWNGGSGFFPGDATSGIEAIEQSVQDRFAAYRNTITTIRNWPEMPRSFKYVADIVDTITNEAYLLKPGKTRSTYEKLLHEEALGREKASEVLGINNLINTQLDEYEHLTDSFKGSQQKPLAQWWKAVRKLRTKCVSLERGGNKEAILEACRTRLPDECLSWIDVVFLFLPDGKPKFNPLLGTGANEGRLDFSNNFMQRITELLIKGNRANTRLMLESSLTGKPVCGLIEASIGQYNPGRAGGYNQGIEIETKNFKINPWDFILLFEGSIALAGNVARRYTCDSRGFESLPFTVRPSYAGFSSTAWGEKCRAEIWMPVWSKPTTYSELRYLVSEGRCSLGRKQAVSGLDFSRALGTLGVDRGIRNFVRYLFLERRGTNYVALPAGFLPVKHRPALHLLEELDPMVKRMDVFIRGFKNIPAAFALVRRQIDAAIYQLCQNPNPKRFSDLIQVLGKMERLIAQRDRSKKPALSIPLGGLSPRWIKESDDGSIEIRLAGAIASLQASKDVGPIRSNLSGVDAHMPWKWAQGHGQQHWHGKSLVERLSKVFLHRMMDAERYNCPMPLRGLLSLSSKDIVSFLYGETRDQKIEDLLWGLTLVDWRKDGLEDIRSQWSKSILDDPIPRCWSVLKILHSCDSIHGISLRIDPRISMLLDAGRPSEAIQVAKHRLRMKNLIPLPIKSDEQIDPHRQLAALIIPTNDQWLLESLVLKKIKNTTKGGINAWES